MRDNTRLGRATKIAKLLLLGVAVGAFAAVVAPQDATAATECSDVSTDWAHICTNDTPVPEVGCAIWCLEWGQDQCNAAGCTETLDANELRAREPVQSASPCETGEWKCECRVVADTCKGTAPDNPLLETEYLGCQSASTRYTVTWDEESGSAPVTSFVVQREVGSSWQAYYSGGPACLLYLSPSTTNFRARAHNEAGYSGWSTATARSRCLGGGGGGDGVID